MEYSATIWWILRGNEVEFGPKYKNWVEITWMLRGYLTNTSLPRHFHEQSPHFDQVPRNIHITSTE
jgi:hypothetical protein